jgi:hypothetical protein
MSGIEGPGIEGGGGGGSTVPPTVQGDLLYASATDVLSALAKSTDATRYLSNTGTDNNPAWAQVNLANGVTGNLPVTNLGSGTNASVNTFWRGDGSWAQVSATGTYTGTMTGFTTTPTLDINYIRIGGLVILQGDNESATSNSTSFTITGAPVAIRPTGVRIASSLFVRNSGTAIPGYALMSDNGTLTLQALIAGSLGSFTNSGTKGIENFQLIYYI